MAEDTRRITGQNIQGKEFHVKSKPSNRVMSAVKEEKWFWHKMASHC